jgi:mevalonate kinase
MNTSSPLAQATAPAKVILFGEHAVVYGQPALAAPVSSLRVTATVMPNRVGARGLRIDLPQFAAPLDVFADALDQALQLTVRLTLEALGVAQPPDFTVMVRSQIPAASGLGSGAAVSAALARAVCSGMGRSMDDATLNDLVYEVEKLHHGTPSGIDNTVIVFERPIYFVKGASIEFLQVGAPISLLIADTGVSASTKTSVSAVRSLWERDKLTVQAWLDQIGETARAARRALETAALSELGTLMRENHLLLQRLTVSSPELDRLVDAADRAGAYGAKMSGGGRGGNMIVLVDTSSEDAVRRALLEAGAVRIFSTKIE